MWPMDLRNRPSFIFGKSTKSSSDRFSCFPDCAGRDINTTLMKQLPVLLVLALGCALLPSCALVETPFNLLNGMLGAVGRSLHVDNNSAKPLHLEQREIEDASGRLKVQPG